jgi:hypothetical protein
MVLEDVARQNAVTERCFPPPWTVEELAACFVVRDHNEQAPDRHRTSRLNTDKYENEFYV